MGKSSIFCIVTIVDEDDKEEKQFLVNYSAYDVKTWLTRTTVWALTNKKTLVLEEASAEDLKTMEMFVPNPERNKSSVAA